MVGSQQTYFFQFRGGILSLAPSSGKGYYATGAVNSGSGNRALVVFRTILLQNQLDILTRRPIIVTYRSQTPPSVKITVKTTTVLLCVKCEIELMQSGQVAILDDACASRAISGYLGRVQEGWRDRVNWLRGRTRRIDCTYSTFRGLAVYSIALLCLGGHIYINRQLSSRPRNGWACER